MFLRVYEFIIMHFLIPFLSYQKKSSIFVENQKSYPFRKVCPVGNSESGQLTIYGAVDLFSSRKCYWRNHDLCILLSASAFRSATAKRRANCTIRCPMDRYDDLLLPGHRLFAQIAVGASEKHSDDAAQAPRIQTWPMLSRANPMTLWHFHTGKAKVDFLE